MTRTMYDAVTVSNIPAGATLVAGYGDGYYQNVAALRTRFPQATVVEIAVLASHNLGTVLDVEVGDASPAQAPGWVRMRRAAGVDPTVYCNSSTWPAVRAAFQAAGVPEPHYWIAQYDNNPAIPPGAIAKQYQDVGPYDLSSVADYWPGVDPAPTPPEDDMPTADEIAAAVWAYPIPNAATGKMQPASAPLIWMDANRAAQTAAVSGSISALAGAVGNLHPGVDTAELIAAVQAAIAAAVVHVNVNVTGAAGPTS